MRIKHKSEGNAAIFYSWAAFLAVIALGLFAFAAFANAQSSNTSAKADFDTVNIPKDHTPQPNTVNPLLSKACISVSEAKKEVESDDKELVSMERTGQSARKIIATINNAGKKTNFKGDQVVAWRVPPAYPHITMFFKDGCATTVCVTGLSCIDIRQKGVRL